MKNSINLENHIFDVLLSLDLGFLITGSDAIKGDFISVYLRGTLVVQNSQLEEINSQRNWLTS